MNQRKLPLADRIDIVEANYGRDFGWHVLSEQGEPLATLTDPRWVEMFWTAYIVTPIDGQTVTQTEEFWNPSTHKIRNIRYPDFMVETFGHYDAKTNRAIIRFDYVKVDFNWTDPLQAPLWFFRRWLKQEDKFATPG